jgi:antitoxin FitA
MTMIQLRNVPEDLHRELKAKAARQGVTLSDLIVRELPRIARRPSPQEVMDRIMSRDPVDGVSGAELVRAVREERDARL